MPEKNELKRKRAAAGKGVNEMGANGANHKDVRVHQRKLIESYWELWFRQLFETDKHSI